MRIAIGLILLGAAAVPAGAQPAPAPVSAQPAPLPGAQAGAQPVSAVPGAQPAPAPFGAQTAPAAPLPVTPELTQLMAQPEHRAALLQAARAVNGPAAPACPAANYAPTGEVVVFAPIQSDGHGKVVAGAWKESLHEIGCGEDRMINTLTAIGQNGMPQTQPLLPGSTISDPQLQQDSVQYAASRMGEMPAGCDQGAITNTRFVGVDGQPPGTRPVAGEAPKPWTEVWSLKACSKAANVTMHFTPDATGTEIRTDPAS